MDGYGITGLVLRHHEEGHLEVPEDADDVPGVQQGHVGAQGDQRVAELGGRCRGSTQLMLGTKRR